MDEELKSQLEAKAQEGRISCAEARKIAEALSVDYSLVGQAANDLKIRIFGCELGCF